MGLPGRRDEYWRFTDPDALNAPSRPERRAAGTDEAPVFDGFDRLKLVFVDGVFDADASDDPGAGRRRDRPAGRGAARPTSTGRATSTACWRRAGQTPVPRPSPR
jgi:Fe-S cluster assembly protein SufD